MQKKYLYRIIIYPIIIIGLFFINRQGNHTNQVSTIDLPTDTSFAEIFLNKSLNDSLPYYEYKRKEDSIALIRNQREFYTNNSGSGFQFGSLGAFSMENKNNGSSNLKNTLYFLGLGDYTLERNSKFYIIDNSYQLTYEVWDRNKTGNTISNKNGHYASKEIKIRYASDRKMVLVPVTKIQFTIINTILFIAAFLTLAFTLNLFIYFPFKILMNISRGNAFIFDNISMLKFMSVGLFVFVFISLIIPYLMHFIFRNIIPTDFVLPNIISGFSNCFFLLLMAVALLITSKAFKKGYELQLDQDLTI